MPPLPNILVASFYANLDQYFLANIGIYSQRRKGLSGEGLPIEIRIWLILRKPLVLKIRHGNLAHNLQLLFVISEAKQENIHCIRFN